MRNHVAQLEILNRYTFGIFIYKYIFLNLIRN